MPSIVRDPLSDFVQPRVVALDLLEERGVAAGPWRMRAKIGDALDKWELA